MYDRNIIGKNRGDKADKEREKVDQTGRVQCARLFYNIKMCLFVSLFTLLDSKSGQINLAELYVNFLHMKSALKQQPLNFLKYLIGMCRTRHSEVGATKDLTKCRKHCKGMKPTKDSNNIEGHYFIRQIAITILVRKHFSIWQSGKSSPLIQLSACRSVGVLIQSIAVNIVFLFAVYKEHTGNNSFDSRKRVTHKKHDVNSTPDYINLS
jgi:hypothetical protein